MGIASFKERSSCGVRHMKICMGGLNMISDYQSSNMTTYCIMVLIEDQRGGPPVCQDVVQPNHLLPSLLVPNSGCPPHSFHLMTLMTI